MSQFLRTVRTSQPQSPAQIDWSNPLSPKSGLWVPNRNLVTGKPVSFGGSGNAPKTVVGPNGTELSTDGQYIQTDISASAFAVLTWCIVLNPAAAPSGANYSSLFQSGQATVNWNHLSGSYQGSFTLHNGGGYQTCQFIKGFVAGVRVILHGTYDGETLRVYRNGVLENSVSAANSTSGTALNALQFLGGVGGTAPFSGSASYMSWDTTRALSAAQIKQHADNVWQVLTPQSRSLWIPGAVVGGGASTVTSDSAAAYAIKAQVQAATSAIYSIQASASSDSTAAYIIRSSVNVDASAAYAIRTVAGSDASAAYAIRAPITANLSAGYSIQTAGAVTSDCAASYGIRGIVQSDASVAYDLRGVVQSTLSAGYDIRASVVKDASAAYALRGMVAKDLGGSYGLRDAVQSDTSAAYAMKSAVVSALAASFGVQGAAPSDLLSSYKVRAPVSGDLVANYSVLAVTSVYASMVASYFVDGGVALAPWVGPEFHVTRAARQWSVSGPARNWIT